MVEKTKCLLFCYYLLFFAVLFAVGPTQVIGRQISMDPYPCIVTYCDYRCYVTGAKDGCDKVGRSCGTCVLTDDEKGRRIMGCQCSN